MRWIAYAILGLAAYLFLYTLVLYFYAPRDSTVMEPVRITRAPLAPGEATLLFAGDTAEADAALPTLQKRGFDHPFAATVDLVRAADVAIANLEAPITDGGDPIPVYTRYVYRAPHQSAEALKTAGFDLLTMANNHAVDYGWSGIRDTIDNLHAVGLELIGAGKSDGEARRGAIFTVGGLKVGVIALCEDQIFFRVWVNLFARRGHFGAAALTRKNLEDDIARLRPEVDVLVVALHAGYNYAPPRQATIDWSERAIDLGADLVVVHHPHVAHPVALYKGKPILLSLGNYAFGTPGHADLDYGWLAQVHLTGKKLDRVELIPLAVQNSRVQFQPRLLDGGELDQVLDRMIAESRGHGATLRKARGRAMLDL